MAKTSYSCTPSTTKSRDIILRTIDCVPIPNPDEYLNTPLDTYKNVADNNRAVIDINQYIRLTVDDKHHIDIVSDNLINSQAPIIKITAKKITIIDAPEVKIISSRKVIIDAPEVKFLGDVTINGNLNTIKTSKAGCFSGSHCD